MALRTDDQYERDRAIENTPEPQPCEACKTPTYNVWFDFNDEPHAACFGRCEDILWSRFEQEAFENECDNQIDAALLGEDD